MLMRGIKYLYSMALHPKPPLYLTHPKLYSLNTTLLRKETDLLEFQDTIFHLQGGGQPNDRGWIQLAQQKYEILGGAIDKESGSIRYKVPPQAQQLPVGTEVQMIIDGELRQTHAKIHSAGHLLDLAVQRLKYPWQAGKGYHFTDGPYVEYKGAAESPEKALAEINEQISLIVASKVGSVNKILSWEQAVQQKLIPETFKSSYVRVIEFAESFCPCGGTHIDNVAEIEQLAVVKVQKKGKNVRVHYKVI